MGTFTPSRDQRLRDGRLPQPLEASGAWGIYTSDGVTLTERYGSDLGNFVNCGEPDINNDGTLAFLTDAGSKIVTGNGGPLTTVADAFTTPFSDFYAPGPALNNLGKDLSSADMDNYTYV